MNQQNFEVIISHGPNCLDGAVAAWCLWRKLPIEYRKLLSKEGGFYSYFQPKKNKKIKYIHPNSIEGAQILQSKGYLVVFIFAQPSDIIPESLISGKNILIIDIDFGDQLIEIINKSNNTLLIDHHISSLTTLQSVLCKTDNNKFSYNIDTSKKECAATLVWKLIETSKLPSFIDTIRIGDTWSWEDNLDAKYILKSLVLNRKFKSFYHIDNLFNNWNKNYNSYIAEGKIILEHENSIINKISKQCSLGYIQTIDGMIYTIAYVQSNILNSDVAANIKKYAEKRFNTEIHFCATWKYVPHKNVVSVSLRNDTSEINLADIAKNIKGSIEFIKSKSFGGGGHISSASFYFTGLENFHNYILKTNPLYTSVYY